MARLSAEQAIKILEAPKNTDKLNQAKLQEDRLVFHCEPIMQRGYLPVNALKYHEDWVKTLLPKDKFKRYQSLLTTPIETVQSTATIFNELSKVFQADNKFIKFDFVSEEIENEANEYAAIIKDEEFWKTKGFKALKTGICDMVVVDMPSKQLTNRPEPFCKIVNIRDVVDLEFLEKDNAVSYIAFKRRDEKFVFIDEESYYLFTKDDKGKYNLDIESKHSVYSELGELIEGLGYTPSCSFYNEPIYGSNGIDKNGPLSKALAKLDWLLFWRVSKKYFELYATWPIMVSYKRTCNYIDENNNECRDGFVNYMAQSFVTGSREPILTPMQKVCPSCEKQSLLGPGTKWEVDAPRDENDVDLLKDSPIKFVEVSSDKLTFVVTELERLENEIYLDIVGWDGDAVSKEAINMDQVQAGFVSKEAVLDDIREKLQATHKFTIDTIYKLRYDTYFIDSIVDWGNNYFLKSEEQLTTEYSAGKLAGLPGYMISDMRDRINRTANKNNPERLLRNQILEQLEPYLDYKSSELIGLQVTNRDPESFIIKLNFNNFIQRFERENMNIVQFGSLLPFKDKISIIQNKLKSYANEQKVTIPQDEPPRT